MLGQMLNPETHLGKRTNDAFQWGFIVNLAPKTDARVSNYLHTGILYQYALHIIRFKKGV